MSGETLFADLTAGLRVDYTGDIANQPGEGVITKTWIDPDWHYEYVTVELDDGREVSTTTRAFNGPGKRFEIAEDQTAPEDRASEATVAEVVALLDSFKLGTARRPANLDVLLINDGLAHVCAAGSWWSVSDNGGELMVELLNSGELRAIPLSAGRRNLNASTVASRVACALRREPIDFETEISDDRHALLSGTYVAEREHGPFWVSHLTPEQHARTCGYWFTVTESATPHTAFATREGLDTWMRLRGLELDQDLPHEGSARILGTYRERCYMDPAQFEAVDSGRLFRTLDNAEYTLGKITEDADGVRVVHYVNVNSSRVKFDYSESVALEHAGWIDVVVGDTGR